MKVIIPALTAATALVLLTAGLAHGDGPILPPPPLPTRLTPTPPPPTMPLQPTINSAIVMLRSGDRFSTVHDLRVGDRARFIVGWRVNEASSIAVAGRLEILKGKRILYRRTLHGRSGSIGGTLYADVHFASSTAIGRLAARFTILLGGSAERTIHFRLLQSNG